MRFYEFAACPAWSTCDLAQAQATSRLMKSEFVEREAPVMTLAALCEEHAPGRIDFLSVDVEGHERQVLQGADWKRFRPVAVVVEATLPNTRIPCHQAWEDVLLAADYRFATFDGLNRYYIRAEDAHLVELLSAPVCIFDDFIPVTLAERQRLLEEKERDLLALAEEARSLRTRLGELEHLGPMPLAVARGVHRAAQRFPRVASAVRRVLGRAA